MHIHIHEQGVAADANYLPRMDIHNEMQGNLTDGDLITIIPVSYYTGTSS